MIFDPGSLIQYLVTYLVSLPAEVMRGDVFAITISVILFYVAILVIQQLTTLVVYVLKKILLLIIISAASYQFLIILMARVSTGGWTDDTIFFGVAGLLIGAAAFATALYAAIRSARKLNVSETVVRTDIPHETIPGDVPVGGIAVAAATVTVPPKSLSSQGPVETIRSEDSKDGGMSSGIFELPNLDMLTDDKSIGAVIVYLVIAQFGVFSSKTIAASTTQVGLGFFIIFIIAALLFVRQSYKDYKRGLRHLAIAFVFGWALSVILGHFWGGYPLDQLLSFRYFTSDSLVALITGLSLSLFMGSRG
jgi:hypothetical protein